MAVNSLGESSHTNLLRYGKRCDSHKGGDRGRSDLRNACRRMNHVEYSHAKDVAARVPGRPVLLVHPEKGSGAVSVCAFGRSVVETPRASQSVTGDPIEPGAKIVPAIRIKAGFIVSSCFIALPRFYRITCPDYSNFWWLTTKFFKLRKDYRTRARDGICRWSVSGGEIKSVVYCLRRDSDLSDWDIEFKKKIHRSDLWSSGYSRTVELFSWL